MVHVLFTMQRPLIGEVHFEGETIIVVGGSHFLHIKAKGHLHELRGSQKISVHEEVFVHENKIDFRERGRVGAREREERGRH